jgi:large subunit ribosomal protein L21
MYAVIETGGKQYKVAVGDTLRVEKLAAAAGGEVKLDKVLMVADGDKMNVGVPHIAGASVTAAVKAEGRGDKVMIFKFRRRKHYRKTQGHRQSYTEIEITGINAA